MQENPRGAKFFNELMTPNLLLSATRPIYDANKKLQGVLTTSFRLSALSEFLETLDMPKDGIVYIIENTHELVANSDERTDLSNRYDGITSLRRHTRTKQSSLIQTSGHYLQNYVKENGAKCNFGMVYLKKMKNIYFK
jgi:hypothetical protein